MTYKNVFLKCWPLTEELFYLIFPSTYTYLYISHFVLHLDVWMFIWSFTFIYYHVWEHQYGSHLETQSHRIQRDLNPRPFDRKAKALPSEPPCLGLTKMFINLFDWMIDNYNYLGIMFSKLFSEDFPFINLYNIM